MTTTVMPAQAAIPRIPVRPLLSAADEATRLDLSAALGLDVDLVLGPIGGDEDELAEYTRLCALVDMADAGVIPRDATLDLIAGIAEEIEAEDDADGFEDDDVFAGGWAA
ncbi:hypothetical protein AB0B15_38415 [Streptomyces sp. NPDC045456]|uniref:hypothetical protein n=1 Tax=Streptomyces sp. NPDC045456 TaxID=3155254 RepID=UPI0033C97D42